MMTEDERAPDRLPEEEVLGSRAREIQKTADELRRLAETPTITNPENRVTLVRSAPDRAWTEPTEVPLEDLLEQGWEAAVAIILSRPDVVAAAEGGSP